MALFKVKVARITYDEIAVSASSEKDAKKILKKNSDWKYGEFDRVESVVKIGRPSDVKLDWVVDHRGRDIGRDTFCFSDRDGEDVSLTDAFFDNRTNILHDAITEYIGGLESQGVNTDEIYDELVGRYFEVYRALESEFLANAKGCK